MGLRVPVYALLVTLSSQTTTATGTTWRIERLRRRMVVAIGNGVHSANGAACAISAGASPTPVCTNVARDNRLVVLVNVLAVNVTVHMRVIFRVSSNQLVRHYQQQQCQQQRHPVPRQVKWETISLTMVTTTTTMVT